MAKKVQWLLLLVLCFEGASAILFGSIRTKIIPTSQLMYIVKPCDILVCCDKNNNLHYFIHTENTLRQCIWSSSSTSPHHKRYVLGELRKWYASVSTQDLTSSVVEYDDAVAWSATDHMDDV